jgi:hypothetical protein
MHIFLLNEQTFSTTCNEGITHMTNLPNVSTAPVPVISIEGKSPRQIAALHAWRSMYAKQLGETSDKRAASLQRLISAYDAALPPRQPKTPKGPPADMHIAGFKAALTRLVNKLPGLKGAARTEVQSRIDELRAIIADPQSAASRKSADPMQALRDELNAARRDSAAKAKAVKAAPRKAVKAAKADPAPATDAPQTETDSATA